MASEPKTLQQAIQHFADPKNCREYLVAALANGVICPRCGSEQIAFHGKSRNHSGDANSRTPRKWAKFHFGPGTALKKILHRLEQKWTKPAMRFLTKPATEMISPEVSRDGVQKSAPAYDAPEIRRGRDDLTGGMLNGEIEVDETFIGGKARNMHKSDKRRKNLKGGGSAGKAIVLGILERETEGKPKRVRTTVIPDRTKAVMQGLRPHVEAGSQIYSDDAGSYWRMDGEYAHEIINHAEEYVRGNVHTNGLENFWSLLKRSIGGSYVSVEPFHLFRYVDEQAFRYNNRKNMNDSDRFDLAVRQILGKRLTWAEVTGKAAEAQIN